MLSTFSTQTHHSLPSDIVQLVQDHEGLFIGIPGEHISEQGEWRSELVVDYRPSDENNDEFVLVMAVQALDLDHQCYDITLKLEHRLCGNVIFDRCLISTSNFTLAKDSFNKACRQFKLNSSAHIIGELLLRDMFTLRTRLSGEGIRLKRGE